MITNPLRPGFYTATNSHLFDKARQDIDKIVERWSDQVSEYALAGNPERAGYIEHCLRRIGR